MREELISSLSVCGFSMSFIGKGRFIEEENFSLSGNDCSLGLKVFYGRGKYLKPWAEIFNIKGKFFGFGIESSLYRSLLSFSWIFVEYILDRETTFELDRGKKPEETRLGKVLLSCGYRSLKDWYFPEGWMEGGPKMQAFAPLQGRDFVLK
ncbi:MAG: DUF1122 family protein [Aquificaceae bacterium]